jgi:hypothetical protein
LGNVAAAQTTPTNAPIEFSIPAQPLTSAISRYGDATGSEALYDASLATGRTSNNVQGLLTPSEALERLLIGSGLSARFVTGRRFVIVPATPAPDQAQALTPVHLRYYALIQQEMLDVLCRLNAARPGRYRIIVAFNIAASGTISHARRVGTVGTVEADQQIDLALRGVVFSAPPPPDFAQPIRILLAPETPGGTPACASAEMRLRANRAFSSGVDTGGGAR